MATLAAYPGMMQRSRKREGLRVCRAAWLVGVSVREYREPRGGDTYTLHGEWVRMVDVFEWPRSFA